MKYPLFVVLKPVKLILSKCSICGDCFPSKKELEKHVLTVHFQCSICDYKTGSKENLKSHIDKFHDEQQKASLCSFCGKYFPLQNKLMRHISIVHEKLKLFQCSVCDHTTEVKRNMKIHIQKVHGALDIKIIYLGDKNHKCYNCDFKSGIKEDLSKHIREVHDGKQNWHCDICNTIYKTKNYLRYHERTKCLKIKKSNEKELVLNDENQKENIIFNEVDETQTPENGHKKEKTIAKVDRTTVHESKELTVIHEQLKPFPCSNCGKCFSTKRKLRNHVLILHENLKLFQCSVCDYQTGFKRNMRKHIDRIHGGSEIEIIYLGDKNHKCYNCDFKSVIKKDLYKHICDVHDGKQNWHCETCNINFKSEKILKVHEGKKSHMLATKYPHEQHKPFPCPNCDKFFSSKGKVKRHVWIVHEKQKLFQCPICDYKTGIKNNMRSHIDKVHGRSDIEMIYLGDENHKCYNCDFKTGLRDDLVKHIRENHDGIQELRCDICNIPFKGPPFKIKSSLKRHTETVHEGKSSQCTICQVSFLQISDLKCHIETVHNKEESKNDPELQGFS